MLPGVFDGGDEDEAEYREAKRWRPNHTRGVREKLLENGSTIVHFRALFFAIKMYNFFVKHESYKGRGWAGGKPNWKTLQKMASKLCIWSHFCHKNQTLLFVNPESY